MHTYCDLIQVVNNPACSGDLEGYPDAAWAAARREVAARAINSIMQRDHEARAQLIDSGGVASVLALLDQEVGSRVHAWVVGVWMGGCCGGGWVAGLMAHAHRCN